MLHKCDEKYVINPDNLYSVLLGEELSKGSRRRGGQIGGATYEGYEESHQEGHFQETHESGSSSHGFFGAHQDPVQISPQHVKLQLRISEFHKGETIHFPNQFKGKGKKTKHYSAVNALLLFTLKDNNCSFQKTNCYAVLATWFETLASLLWRVQQIFFC